MRRLTVECSKGHREEILIGANDRIPRCPKPCTKKREIVWIDGSAGFRIKGMTKRF